MNQLLIRQYNCYWKGIIVWINWDSILFLDTSQECLTHVPSYLVSVVWCKTSFTFLCSKDFLRITDGVDKIFGEYCGNQSVGQTLRVTGDHVKIMFHSDGEIERRGYLLNFTLVSLPSFSSGKWNHKEADKTWRVLLPRGGSRGRMQEVCTLPILRRNLLLCIRVPRQSVTLFLSVAPPPKKNPGCPASLPGRLLGRLPSLIVSYLSGN